ncbi:MULTISPECIES: flagellar biosynthesis anti-sigma factor FlgM [unclassified Sporolactobacillus]|uniref:flagellar biosynthesis anti-sigma factor FlgM n=1 Tax=unclassified Sporolactobacillus TaxID=2628533 RepID=UPI002368D776|nr:flagellar biosynthesis anti-sigma factor FlgM [Sporolactobacillus sp. CQH2019]MDD9148049.1 flagellar biosynthesis anti-sigma factor FlgM [Sporolactobacillus sp. CQH2019]
MKVNRYQPIQPYTNYNPGKPADQPAAPAAENDKVEISSEAKRLQGSQRLEEARRQKVDQIKNQVDAGTYHVASEDVAQKIYAYWNQK